MKKMLLIVVSLFAASSLLTACDTVQGSFHGAGKGVDSMFDNGNAPVKKHAMHKKHMEKQVKHHKNTAKMKHLKKANTVNAADTKNAVPAKQAPADKIQE